jgi:hypothetical protein
MVTPGSRPTTQPDDVWQSPRGSLVISYPGGAVMVFTYHGYMTADVVPFVDACSDRMLATGATPDFYVDLEDLAAFDSEYRRQITKWGERAYRSVGEAVFLVRSRIIAISVAVSNLAVGGKIKAVTKRADFEAAVDAAVRRHTGQAPAGDKRDKEHPR